MTDLSFDFKQLPQLKQMQHLMMSAKMQQALLFLQMPALELAALIQTQVEQNPVLMCSENEGLNDDDLEETEDEEQAELSSEKFLSFNDQDFSTLEQKYDSFPNEWSEDKYDYSLKNPGLDHYHSYIEQSIPFESSLFGHLMHQAKETLNSPEDLVIAEALIGDLNQGGYLHTPLDEISKQLQIPIMKIQKVLACIQTFRPYGIAATSLQEGLLIQLHMLGKKKSVAAKIVDKHYEDLLHNRINAIQKNLNCTESEITYAIKELSNLDLHPGLSYARTVVQPIISDISMRYKDGHWIVTVNDDHIPTLCLNGKYTQMIADETVVSETKEFILQHIASAKWLLRNIYHRNETLTNIVLALSKWQKAFLLEPEGKLLPLTMKMLAEELGVHESTIARTVSNKYVDTPKGILSLRSFFSNGYEKKDGSEISSETVRDHIRELIGKEDKKSPYSDSQIAKNLESMGIDCARRTIAKYRAELNFGNAQQRRKF